MTYADVLEVEGRAWRSYRAYCRKMNPGTGFQCFGGDPTSHALWRVWKAAYEAKLAGMPAR